MSSGVGDTQQGRASVNIHSQTNVSPMGFHSPVVLPRRDITELTPLSQGGSLWGFTCHIYLKLLEKGFFHASLKNLEGMRMLLLLAEQGGEHNVE